jgi:hypothetical protein
MLRILLTVACLTMLAGCVRFEELDCGEDWNALGQRDGVLGAFPQGDVYARRCSGAVDDVRYRDGWDDGYRRRPTPAGL